MQEYEVEYQKIIAEVQAITLARQMYKMR